MRAAFYSHSRKPLPRSISSPKARLQTNDEAFAGVTNLNFTPGSKAQQRGECTVNHSLPLPSRPTVARRMPASAKTVGLEIAVRSAPATPDARRTASAGTGDVSASTDGTGNIAHSRAVRETATEEVNARRTSLGGGLAAAARDGRATRATWPPKATAPTDRTTTEVSID